MKKEIIFTDKAPKAIGTYSQAVKVNNTVYISGQIPLIAETMEVIDGSVEEQIHQVFKNMQAIIEAAGGTFENVVKLNIFLTDISNFPTVNQVMAQYFTEPYPARAAIGVKELPKDVPVEMDAILEL